MTCRFLFIFSALCAAFLLLSSCGGEGKSRPPPAGDGGRVDGAADDGGLTDGGPARDAGVVKDGGVVADGSTVEDGGVAADGGQAADGGAIADGSQALDGGPVEDGGVIADEGAVEDGGIAADGGTARDGGVASDGGPAMDGGIVEDGGVASDGGPIEDGGVAQDGGIASDGGQADGGGIAFNDFNDGEDAADPGSRSNETAASAVPITLPAVVTGAIGAYDSIAETADEDVFTFHGLAGTFIRVAIDAAGSSLHPNLLYFGEPGTDYANESVFPAGENLVKWIFIPEDGDYFLAVADHQTLLGDQSGGAAYGYTMTVQEDSNISAEQLDFPTEANLSKTLSSRGHLGVFTSDLESTGACGMEILAKSLSSPSDIDPILMVFDTANNRLAWRNDDSGRTGGPTDSFAAFVGASRYLIVVDTWSLVNENDGQPIAAPDLRFEVKTTVNGPATAEAEPNDATDLPVEANPISVNQAVSGRIWKDGAEGAVERDSDWYVFFCTRGEYYRASVTAAGGGLDPFLMVNSFRGYFQAPDYRIEAMNDNGPGALAQAEFLCSRNGIVYLVVEDYRNTQSPAAYYGGVSGFEYEIALEPMPARAPADLGVLSSAPIEREDAVAGPGMIVWYTFQPQGPAMIEAVGLGSLAEPFLRLYEPDGWTPVQFAREFIFGMLDSDKKYWLGVQNIDGEGGPDGYEYRLRAFSASEMEETEANNAYSFADGIPGLPVVVNAELESGGEDWFRVKLLAGTTATVFTTFGAGADDVVDTMIVLYRLETGGGTSLVKEAENDDIAAPDNPFSRISDYAAPSTGYYYIKVSGYDQEETGPYSLVVREGPCPGAKGAATPGPENVIINEFLPDPNRTEEGGVVVGCDAGGDGVIETADEFVELVNPAMSAVDLGGLMLVDRKGDGSKVYLRHRFACGTILESLQAVVLLAGEPVLNGGTMDYGSAAVMKTNVSNLALDNDGDTLALLAKNAGMKWELGPPAYIPMPDGGIASLNPVTMIEYSDSMEGSSSVRCAGEGETDPANCDQGSVWNFHEQVCQSGGGCHNPYCSPGRHTSGVNFGTTLAETCEQAPNMAWSIEIAGQNLQFYRNDYWRSGGGAYSGVTDAGGACGKMLESWFAGTGPDAVAAVTPPDSGTMDVYLTEMGDWDSAFVVTTDCGGINDATCVAARDHTVAQDEQAEGLPVTGGVTYFIIVDTYNGEFEPGGEFTLRIELH